MHNPFTVCDPLGLSPYSRFKGLGWLTDNQLTRPSFRYQRLVTDQSYEQQWILPDGREVHVNGGLRDGWITEAKWTGGDNAGEWKKSPYNPDFKHYDEGRLTAQADKLLALNEDLGGKGVRNMVSNEWGAAHVNEVLSKAFPEAYARGQLKALSSGRQRHEWNEFMAEVIAMLEELRDISPLTAEAAAARYLAQEWTPGSKVRDGVETSWDKGSVGGWIQTFGGGAVSVSFFVWIRDVDESGYFDDLDAVYEEGEQVLADFLPEIEESPLAGHLIEAERTEADADEYIKLKKWALGGRILTAGVIQHDTDLPVMVMVVLEEPGAA